MGMGFARRPPAPGPPKTGAGLPLAVGTGKSSNPDKFGLTKPVAAPAATRPPGVRTSPINNPLVWLVNALRLNNQAIPTDLLISQVTPTIDIGGNGWPLAVYQPQSFVTDSSPGQVAFWIVPPDPVNTQVLVGFLATQLTLAQPALLIGIGIAQGQVGTVGLGTMPTILNLFASEIVAQGYIPTSPNGLHLGSIAQAAILGGQRYIVAPPTFGITYIQVGNTVGQQQNVTAMIATIPGSFAAGR